MATTIKPLHDRILIRRNDVDKMSKGGIHIPDSAKDQTSTFGFVEACGPGVVDQTGKFHEVSVKPGDEVIIGKYAGSQVDLGDRIERSIVRDDDILAVITRD